VRITQVRQQLASFDELDWQRIDVWAIAGCAGLASVFEQAHPFYHDWLEHNGYAIDLVVYQK